MNRQAARQISAFAFVGAISYMVYWAIYEVAALELSQLTSLVLGYLAGLGVHFSLNKVTTFADTRRVNLQHVGRYAAVVLANFLVSLSLTWTLLQSGLSPAISIAAGIAVTMVQGFLLCRNWVFKEG